MTESAVENQDTLDVGVYNRDPQVPEMDVLKNADEDTGLDEEDRITKPIPPVHFHPLESEHRILEVVRPVYVIVYDPDMSFVREMEVYKSGNPDHHLKVYFLFYEDSTEVRKFEASIRRENSAFENLIHQKASMMIPVDQHGRMLESTPPKQSATCLNLNAITRKAGGQKQVEKQMQVVVDVREFGSSLPCVIHQQGIKILPVTLEVGDYILSPDMCVERKSIADLFSSFSSGRLYHQVETMTRYYRLPVLLIEFSQDKSFAFQVCHL
jgi:DNA excision repair protein ERCC-4